MPRRQRRWGGWWVTSSASNMTRPESARRSPLIRLNSVVLPAPLGPSMPSVSPAATDSVTPSATLSAPKLLLMLSSARMAAILLEISRSCSRPPSPLGPGIGREGRRSAHQLQLAGRGDRRKLRIVDEDQFVFVLLALDPLTEHQRGLADVLERTAAAPLHVSDHGLQAGGGDCVANRRVAAQVLGALQCIHRDFE